MSLRVKLVLALVLLSAMVTVTIGAWSYAVTADRLHAELDASLEASAATIVERLHRTRPPGSPGDFDRDDVPDAFPGFDRGDIGGLPGRGDLDDLYQFAALGQEAVQVVDSTGEVVVATEDLALPVDEAVVALAGADADAPWIYSDVSVDGEAYRVVVAPIGQGRGAVQVARSQAETDRVLDSLRNLTLLAVVAVTFVAAAIGWLIARQITRRLVRLTDAAEEVAQTGRLDVSVPVGGTDEAGRLGSAFNEMLVALGRSRDAQQRLVQDAGHELRTPLTSLRTNISVLRRHNELPPETLGQVLDDVDGEARELTELVNELVELATERRSDEPDEEVAFGALVERVADRARRRTGRTVSVDLSAAPEDITLIGRPSALERAVSNLIDNAAKFDDSDAPIDVVVRDGRIEVSDRGPGIDPTDLPHLFDRFYRAVNARSRPGSGLGLAIVADIAQSHGGTVFASNREGGGATVGFEIPCS